MLEQQLTYATDQYGGLAILNHLMLPLVSKNSYLNFGEYGQNTINSSKLSTRGISTSVHREIPLVN